MSGWNDLTISGGISIVSGATYYVAFNTNNVNDYAYLSSSGTQYYLIGVTYGTWPSTSSAFTSESGNTFNLRMTYSIAPPGITTITSTPSTTLTKTTTTASGTSTLATTSTSHTVTSAPSTSTSTTHSTTVTSPSSTSSTSTSTSLTVTTINQPCSYQIFTQGTTTYAQNCATGLIAYSGTAPETVINDAIAVSSGGRVYIEAGTYTFTTINIAGWGAIGSSSVSNVELYGAGNSTILLAGTNMNGAMIALFSVNGWYIHDLEINGNAASQSLGGASTPYQSAISTYESSNDIMEHCYVLNWKTYGIYFGGGSSNQVLYNGVVNSWANGIIMYGSSNSVVKGNTVIGVSDVGISISGMDSTATNMENILCSQNTVLDVNMGISPFGQNSGVGIMVGDNGASENVTVSNNQISTVSFGVSDGPYGSAANILVIISGNTIRATTIDGIYAAQTTGLTISGNTFTFSQGVAWNMDPGVTGLVIANNYVNGVLETGTTTLPGSAGPAAASTQATRTTSTTTSTTATTPTTSTTAKTTSSTSSSATAQVTTSTTSTTQTTPITSIATTVTTNSTSQTTPTTSNSTSTTQAPPTSSATNTAGGTTGSTSSSATAQVTTSTTSTTQTTPITSIATTVTTTSTTATTPTTSTSTN
ncbi:MAG: right-handed parallel beta-helix repeat-containing protein [Candidatus Bathyarchaeia archaeon]